MILLNDCERCMQANDRLTRQTLGCGYEQPLAGEMLPFLDVWKPEGMKPTKDFPSVCAGYTVRLPEVIEIARARVHWEKGALPAFCGGPPTDKLLLAVEMLDGASNELEAAQCTPRSKGGLADG